MLDTSWMERWGSSRVINVILGLDEDIVENRQVIWYVQFLAVNLVPAAWGSGSEYSGELFVLTGAVELC